MPQATAKPDLSSMEKFTGEPPSSSCCIPHLVGRQVLLSSSPLVFKLSLFVPLRQIFSSSLSPSNSHAAGSALNLTRSSAVFLISSLHTTRAYSSKRKMGPKKEVKQEKLLLGRPGNNLKSGIVCANKCVLCASRVGTELTWNSLAGWTRQCRKVDFLPSHHEMLSRQPGKFPLRHDRPRRSASDRAG